MCDWVHSVVLTLTQTLTLASKLNALQIPRLGSGQTEDPMYIQTSLKIRAKTTPQHPSHNELKPSSPDVCFYRGCSGGKLPNASSISFFACTHLRIFLSLPRFASTMANNIDCILHATTHSKRFKHSYSHIHEHPRTIVMQKIAVLL